MLLRLIITALALPAMLSAKETDFSMEADGFAVIHTFSLTGGKICRKLDHYTLPTPVAWHIRPEWNAIYLGREENTGEKQTATEPKFQIGCQRGISQSTLVGPLKKGKWQAYGTASVSVGKTVTFSERLEIRQEAKAWVFKIENPAVASVMVQYYSNTTGRCHEYVPLILRIEAGKDIQAENTLHATPAVFQPLEIHEGGICRALPQTIAQGTMELAPGKYRISGENVKRVSLFSTKNAAQ